MTSTARALAVAGADIQLRKGPGIYKGFTLRETGGANGGTAKVYDSSNGASGTLLETINLDAGKSDGKFYEGGIAFDNGIYVDFGGTGTLEGSIRVGAA
jgi:hypothetical protein